MGDEQDRFVLVAQFAHQPMNQQPPVMRQCGGRFIHNEQFRLVIQSSGDFDQLALLKVQRQGRQRYVHLTEIDKSERFFRFLMH
ncbi:hypothetical protein D1872_284160 [compost metagenome]